MASAPVTNRERERMREMRARGMSLSAIGAELGRSERCVSGYVRDIPIRTLNGRPGMDAAAKARLIAAHAAGASTEDIAQRFGVARASVYPLLNRARKLQQAGASA